MNEAKFASMMMEGLPGRNGERDRAGKSRFSSTGIPKGQGQGYRGRDRRILGKGTAAEADEWLDKLILAKEVDKCHSRSRSVLLTKLVGPAAIWFKTHGRQCKNFDE